MPQLRPEINAWYLWSLAVGLVISGEYFGWNYGWGSAGTVGFLITTLIVAVLYVAFIFSFTELTTAIPHAGGPFAYALRAFGPAGGLIAGYATLVEFLFAPPAIARRWADISISCSRRSTRWQSASQPTRYSCGSICSGSNRRSALSSA